MSIFDSIGTALEGGLWARSVEPRAGSGAGDAAAGANGHTHEGNCLNCGTALMGPHCHGCGQKAHVHKTLGAFMHDLLHGALHFEGKTWHTLPLLALKPGQLTRRYIEGERARFVSPMALFLFSIFLMFAVFQLAGIGPPTDLGPPVQIGEQASPEEAREELQDLRRVREEMDGTHPASVVIDEQIEQLEEQLGSSAPEPGETEVLAESANGGGRLTAQYTGIALFDRGIKKWKENPGLMAYKLQANSYKFSWLLIPLSVPFVWLIFAWKRRFGCYDHAIFVTYSLAFMTLFYVALVLLGALGVPGGTLALLGTLVPLVHIYKQTKYAYGLSRFSAAWRTVALTFFIFVILFLFIDLLLVLGALG